MWNGRSRRVLHTALRKQSICRIKPSPRRSSKFTAKGRFLPKPDSADNPASLIDSRADAQEGNQPNETGDAQDTPITKIETSLRIPAPFHSTWANQFFRQTPDTAISFNLSTIFFKPPYGKDTKQYRKL